MPEVILISQMPLPFSKIGSWSQLYKNYFSSNHSINHIVCSKPENFFADCQYSFVSTTIYTKIIQKITNNKFLGFQKALHKIIQTDKKYIIQIVDDFGLTISILHHLKKNNLRKQCYIQFFYHGFMPYDVKKSDFFYQNIDELVLLTQLSYNKMKLQNNIITPKIAILHNGIDTTKFFRLDNLKKLKIIDNLNLSGNKIFIWCSQDRPKKGLHIILEAWKSIHEKNPNSILLVIGSKSREPQNGVRFLGKIPNNELPQYYQVAHVYLFPTLCQEGFGMSLIEALHCGCYCIASALGGVPEVLNNGQYGVLIDNPNFVSEWILEMQRFIDNNNQEYDFPNNLYTTNIWNDEMNKIIENARNAFV